MDASEATKIVMSRIQSLDPENVSKIMGYTLIQDQGEKEMIRLAFSPDALLQSHVEQAKARLGLSSNPNSPFAQRIALPNNGFHFSGPSSPAATFQGSSPRPLSYAAVLESSGYSAGNGSGSPSLHFYGGDDFGDEFLSCSASDAAFLEEGGSDSGLLWRPCLYFARGFCKNGSSCKFLHSDIVSGEGVEVGSPGEGGTAGFEELLRMKAAVQHQRFAVMASGGHFPFGYNKCFNSTNGNLRGDLSSSSRQIYLTFPADSTFKEEDVSNYFSMFGPVQDVRIPYQQKRMFGFVTFVYPETVKLILAKGNPHFLCDCRVLVKPYKEKGKVREKKQQQQQSERAEHPCLSPTGVDSREAFEFPFGSRMAMSPQEMTIRGRLEQPVELQHAIGLQGQRMMNLQLMDTGNLNHTPLLMRSSIPYHSPRLSQLVMNQHVTVPDYANQHDSEVFAITELDGAASLTVASSDEKSFDVEGSKSDDKINGGSQLHQPNADGSDLLESLEKNALPDIVRMPDSVSSSAARFSSIENIAESFCSNIPRM